jgi:hypothetical protein
VGERIEVVEAGPILRIVLEFWFVIWLIRVWCDKKNWLPAVTSGYQRLPAVTSGYQRLPVVTSGYLEDILISIWDRQKDGGKNMEECR